MRIAVTGGGTGGHVFPALQVLQELGTAAEEEVEILWLGSTTGPEYRIVTEAGIPFAHIASGKLRRYFSWQNVADAFRILIGFFQSLNVLRRFSPDILFSKGGFVSVPPVIAARLLHIPSVTHESDLDPGLANRINATFVEACCIPYEASKRYYPAALETVVTGNPVRRELIAGDGKLARKRFGIPEDQYFVLVLGGSQGALEINNVIWEWAEEGIEGLFILHQAGHLTYKELAAENYLTVPLITEGLGDLLAAADLVISRAGAGAIAEFALNRLPMILIPKGLDSSRGDQIRNARLLSDGGAAIMIKDAEVTLANLKNTVLLLQEDEERAGEMGKAAYAFAEPDAAARIAAVILQHKK